MREHPARAVEKEGIFMGGFGMAIPLVLLGVGLLLSGLKILREYERAVIFRLGRLVSSRGPGVIYVIPFVERMVRNHKTIKCRIGIARETGSVACYGDAE